MSDEAREKSVEEDKPTIIVVDDISTSRSVIVAALRPFGFNIVECKDGLEAWDAIESEEHGKVMATISDIIMPNMDGLVLLKKIRESEKFRKLPFILVTGHPNKDYVVEAKNLKVDGFVTKPFSSEKLLVKLKPFFPNKSF